jgi:transposase-like protein
MVLVHTTIPRWVQHYVPEFEKCWRHYERPVGGSWRCDETYVKVKGKWTYLYRAVDKVGRTVDFYLSERRDVKRCETLFPQSDEECGATASDHSRCLCRFTSSSSRVEAGRSVAKACPGAIE